MAQNIYSVPPTPPKEHHEATESLHTIVQGMQAKIYEQEGMAEDNAVLNSSNSAVMEKLVQLNVTMNYMQAQMKTSTVKSKNPKITKRKSYCWICVRKLTHGNKPALPRKLSIKRRNTTRRDLGEVKWGANDG